MYVTHNIYTILYDFQTNGKIDMGIINYYNKIKKLYKIF